MTKYYVDLLPNCMLAGVKLDCNQVVGRTVVVKEDRVLCNDLDLVGRVVEVNRCRIGGKEIHALADGDLLDRKSCYAKETNG